MKGLLRLDRILANMSYGTRNEIKKLIKKGLVKVNGAVEKDPARKVHPRESRIEINGELVDYHEFTYVMLNKPAGYISATEDVREQTVLELLSAEYQALELFPVGRLDKDTEGLLILTNDGKLGHHVTSPKNKVPKTYYALVQGKVGEADGTAFSQGIVLEDGYKTLPAELTILKPADRSEIELVVYEGKFHQVKRMFQARGKEVLYLKRIKIGRLGLDERLAPGQYRELTGEELALIL